MKTIGLLGGMSWESTAVYYRLLNELTRARLGGLHSAQLALWSFDFAGMEPLQRAGNWAAAGHRLVEAARKLERAGARCLLICTNTMHRLADEVQAEIDIPLIHIVDATAAAIERAAARSPLLLGTRYTMEQDFYRGRLRRNHGIDVRIPDAEGRAQVHDVIYRELCTGRIEPRSRTRFLAIVESAREAGADSVILGCTEVGLLLSQSDLDIPVFDSTEIHARAAVDFALSET